MFKRFFLLAGCWVLGAVSAVAVPAKLGDLDEDGVPTVADLSKILRHMDGSAPLVEPLKTFADLNGDGAVNDLDLDEVVKEILGTRTPQTLPLATVRGTHPTSGEGDVSLNRETIIHFSMPLAVDAVLDTNQLYGWFAGRRLLSRVELSSDRLKAILFYLEPLPSSARVRVFINAPGLKDVLGRDVDLDGDGVGGGSYSLTFDTLSVTPVVATAISGKVFASERGSGGAEVPLAGVTITVDGAEQEIRAVTDAAGNFTLTPCPAGSFFVTIDGRTSPSSAWPNGNYYPFVGKRWEAVAGRADNLAGNTEDTPRNGNIYLPLIRTGSLQSVSATQPTLIDLPASIITADPRLAGLQLTVPSNSLFSNDGTRGGRVGVAPVAPDRLPSPLPPGLAVPAVITIQTDGPANFDRPVGLCFPNLPDPLTGLTLPAGAKSALWSFNHDTGNWEIAAPMTVTADGLFVKTDPGTGVRQPGWHAPAPGSSGSGASDGCDNPETKKAEAECFAKYGDQCNFSCSVIEAYYKFMGGPGSCDQANLKDQPKALAKGVVDGLEDTVDAKAAAERLKNELSWYKDLVARGQGLSPAAIAYRKSVKERMDKLRKGATDKAKVIRPKPGSDAVVSLTQLAEAMQCKQDNAEKQKDELEKLPAGGTDPYKKKVESAIDEISSSSAAAGVVTNGLKNVLGPSLEGMAPAVERLGAALGPLATVFGPFLPLPAPAGAPPREDPPDPPVTVAQIDALMAVVEGMKPDLDAVVAFKEANEEILELAKQTEVAAMEWQNVAADQSRASGDAPLSPPGQRFVKVVTTDEFGRAPLTLRFKTGLDGRVNMILRPLGSFDLIKYDPQKNSFGKVFGWASDNGQVTQLPLAMPSSADGLPDTDGDGLADAAEDVVGTNPNKSDSDDDGIRDLAEVQAGTNPLDGAPAQTGIITTSPTTGPAFDIAAFDGRLAVAEDTFGFEVLGLRPGGRDPVRVFSFDTPGVCRSVAINESYAAAADSSGLYTVEVARLTEPGLRPSWTPVGDPASCVTLLAATAFVGTDSGKIITVDLPTATVLETLTTGAGRIEDLTVRGDYLYAVKTGTLYTIPLAARPFVVGATRGFSGGPAVGRRQRVFAGQDSLYITYGDGFRIFDLASPANPPLVSSFTDTQNGWRQIVGCGSGFALSAAGPNPPNGDVGVYLVDALGRTPAFVSTFTTPGTGEAIAVYGGMAYVADGGSGIQVVNYLAPDPTGVPPTLTLQSNVALTGGTFEEGKILRLTAVVDDDLQVRDVSFLMDGRPVGTDGSFPFETRLIAPQLTAEKMSFTVQAIATDTGGNRTLSPVFTINLSVDATPPTILNLVPSATAGLLGGTPLIGFTASEALWQDSIDTTSVRLIHSGPDRVLGNADDVTVPALPVYRGILRAVYLELSAPLQPGLHRLIVSAPLADAAGNPLVAPVQRDFRVYSPVDSDVDGLADEWEPLLNLQPGVADTNSNGKLDGAEDFDNDGLHNAAEIAFGSNPAVADTNGNGIPDGQEDGDFDGLTDAQEFLARTDPRDPDSDDDTFTDEAEITGESNPLLASSVPWFRPGAIVGRDVKNILRLATNGAEMAFGVVSIAQQAGALKLNTTGAAFPLGSVHNEQGDANVHRLHDSLMRFPVGVIRPNVWEVNLHRLDDPVTKQHPFGTVFPLSN